jgi:hypothetical protein
MMEDGLGGEAVEYGYVVVVVDCFVLGNMS